MQFQEWLRSLRFTGGDGKSEVDNLKTLLPSLPSSFSLSSLSLSPSSIIGLGALASLTTYWLVTRPRPIQPPCDLQAQSIPVQVTVLLLTKTWNKGEIKYIYYNLPTIWNQLVKWNTKITNTNIKIIVSYIEIKKKT